MNRRKKNLKLKLKTEGIDDSGYFEAYANVFGVVDSYNDVTVPNCFQPTFDYHNENNTTIKLLYQHDPDKVIGVIEDYGVDEVGLWIKARLNVEIPLGEEVYSNLKMGALDSLSIGYDELEVESKDGINYLTKVLVHEVSIVTFPANTASVVTLVKSKETDTDTDTEQISVLTQLDLAFKQRQQELSKRKTLMRLRAIKKNK